MNKRGLSPKVRQILCAVREKADRTNLRRANVIGSMIGAKLSNDQVTGDIGITYLVSTKVTRDELARRDHIPKAIKQDGQWTLTDVLQWPDMKEQSVDGPLITFDGNLQGTLSCFGRSKFGLFGVTCAHCLCGVDKNPATPTDIALYSRALRSYVPVGTSSYAIFSPGAGMPGQFGYVDCGSFLLSDQSVQKRAAQAHKLRLVDDVRSLVGQKVFGKSALSAPGATSHTRSATILGAWADALGERCDLVLRTDNPGTFQGDSGLLWFSQAGFAAAIHSRGEIMPSLEGSRLVTAMSASRAASILGLEFFDAID